MKNIILGLIIAVIYLTGCNGNNKSIGNQKRNETLQLKSTVDKANVSTSPAGDTKNIISIKEILNAYLQMKNAFTDDKSIEAATAGKELQTAFKNFDQTILTEVQKKTYEDVADDAIEHAEHIGSNGGNIEHQREHFDLLSKDIYDLVKAFGGGQILYKDFDPMFNNGKGAFWVSETKEIRNPYMGKAMLTSGSVLEEIK